MGRVQIESAWKIMIAGACFAIACRGGAQTADQTPQTQWRAGNDFTGNQAQRSPTPIQDNFPFDLTMNVNPHSSIHGGTSVIGNIFGPLFLRVVAVNELDSLGVGWFYSGGSSADRYYVYDADGSAIAFTKSGGVPSTAVDTDAVHSSLSYASSIYTLTNAGPPGSLRQRGLWTYNFDSYGRLTCITDPANVCVLLDYTPLSGHDCISVTRYEASIGAFGQSLYFTHDTSTTWNVRVDSSSATPLGTITVASSPSRATQVAWTDVPAVTLGYSGSDNYFTSIDDGLTSQAFAWGTYTPAAYKRTNQQSVGGLDALNLTPSYPTSTSVQVLGQIGSDSATGTTTLYEQASSQLKLSYIYPTYNGATDSTSTPDFVKYLNADGTLASITYSWDTTSGHDKTATFAYNSDDQITDFYDFGPSSHNHWSYGYTSSTIAGASGSSAKLMNSITDPTGATTSWTYDNDGGTATPDSAITSYSDPGGFTTTFAYNTSGVLDTVTLPGHTVGWTLGYIPDNAIPSGDAGNLTSVTDPMGYVFSIGSWDQFGNDTSWIIQPDGYTPVTTSAVRDGFGRITEIDYSDLASAYLSYDATSGAITSVTDPAGRTNQIDYLTDGSGLIDKFVLDPSGTNRTFLAFTWNAKGWLTRAEDQNHVGVSYLYGNQSDSSQNGGEVSQVSYDKPSSGVDTDTYEYYRNGLLHKITTSASDVIEYLYDDNFRLTGIKVNTYDYAVYTYDDAGRMLTALRKDISTGYSLVRQTFDYDSSSKRLNTVTTRYWTSSTAYFDRTIDYTYNDDGTRASLHDGTQTGQLDYYYDDAGRLTEIDEDPVSLGDSFSMDIGSLTWGIIARWDYDHAGRIANQYYNNDKLITGFTMQDAYDSGHYSYGHGFIQELNTTWDPTTSARTDFTYTGYADNRIDTFIATKGGSSWTSGEYTYDSMGQIYTESGPRSDTYGFDSSFNLTSKNGRTLSYDTNRLTTVVNGGTTENSFHYNSLGARSDDNPAGSGTPAYEWTYDAFGNVVSEKHTGSTIYTCDYDALGHRFKQVASSTTTFFMYDGDQLYDEMNSSGTVQKRYYWGLTGPVCQRISGGNHWYIADASGNTRALVGDTGTITDYYTYDAWGNQLSSYSSGSTANPFRWNGSFGYQYISTTGLYHVGAREYDPVVARWLQRDPDEMEGGWSNLYGYYANDPIQNFDPDGTQGEHKPPLGGGNKTSPPFWIDKDGNVHKGPRPPGHGDGPPGSSKDRQRNVKHPDAEEHSLKDKGGKKEGAAS